MIYFSKVNVFLFLTTYILNISYISSGRYNKVDKIVCNGLQRGNVMEIVERIRMSRIAEKIERNKEFCKKIGIRSMPVIGKVREQENEVHRC